MKRIYIVYLFLVAFALLINLKSFGQTVQAESYTASSGGDGIIMLENSGSSVGYFDKNGETLTYSINVTTAGYYQLAFKYLAGDAGQITVRTAQNAEALVSYAAVTNPGSDWWLLPMTSWPSTSNSPYFYFNAGVQNFYLINKGIGFNIDYFTLTYSANQSITISSINVTPNPLSVKPTKTASLSASAISSTGAIVAVPLTWSANAPAGVYTAGAVGTDQITVSYQAITKNIPVSIAFPSKKQNFVVSHHGDLSVSSTGFVDKNNVKASFTGPSWFWSCSAPKYWNKEAVNNFVKDWKATLIRLPMAIAPGMYDNNGVLTGTTWNDDNYYKNPEFALNQMRTMIDAAIENDIYVIVDFHEHFAHKFVNQAKAFFEVIAREYGGYDNVIFEIFNEPLSVSWSEISTYAQQVIPVIRQYSNNIIVVGTPTWSQRVDQVDNSLTAFGNIAYTLHYYAATHGSSLLSKMDLNKPVCITECGNDSPAMNDYISKAKQNGVSMASWAVNNKGIEGDELWSIFNDNNQNFTGPWSASDIRVGAGTSQQSIMQNWPRAVEATVICEDNTVSSLLINAPKTTIYLNEPLNLTVTGKSSCKDIAVSSPVWSSNAPAGVFSSNQIGTYTLSVTAAGLSTSILISVITDPSIVNVPATIEAENYLQMNGIQKETCTEGGQNIGYIDATDWLTYKINVPATGSYKVSYRVASLNGGGSIKMEKDAGATTIGSIAVASTTGWQQWATISQDVSLPAGTYEIRVLAVAGGFNLNWIGIQSNVTIPVSSVSVTPSTVAVGVGSTSQLTASVLPANATDKTVSWSSSNTSIASVNAAGLVSGVAAGTAVVTATTASGSFTSSSTITVSNVACTGISLSPATLSLALGTTGQLTATIAPLNATNKNVTYTSSNTAISTVSATGLVTAVAAGTANVTVKSVDGDFTAICAVSVTSAPAFSVKIEAESYTMKSTAPLSETCTEGGLNMGWIGTSDWMVYPVNLPSTGVYTVNFRVASPNATAKLRLDANSGTTVFGSVDVPNTGGWQIWQTVSVQMTLNGGSYNLGLNALMGGVNINWIEIVGGGVVTPVSVTGISLTATASVEVGASSTLTATIAPSNASNKNVTWTSSNTAVASVNASGVVTGVANGTANITASSVDGGFTATCAISVTTATCPTWAANTNYASGTVVTYLGQNYTSNNSWNGTAGDPYTATHVGGGWGWVIGGTCTKSGFVNSSEVLKVAIMTVYPNPVNDGIFNIAVAGFESQEVLNIQIVNLGGQVVYTKQVSVNEAGDLNIQISSNENIKAGVYIVKIQASETVKQARLIVN